MKLLTGNRDGELDAEREALVKNLCVDLTEMREQFRGSLSHLSISERQAIIRQPLVIR